MSSVPENSKAREATAEHRAEATSETYGGDDLPVLIRLPDLSVATSTLAPAEDNESSPVSGESLNSEKLPAADTNDSATDEPARAELSTADAVSEEVQLSQPLTGGPSSTTERQEQGRSSEPQRQVQLTRLRTRSAAVPGWVRSLGQFAFAAMLAGVLLLILITLKEDSSLSTVGIQSILFDDRPHIILEAYYGHFFFNVRRNFIRYLHYLIILMLFYSFIIDLFHRRFFHYLWFC